MAGLQSFDEYAKLRLRRAGLVVPDPEREGGGRPAFVGRVTSTGSRIAVGSYLLVQPTFVLGDEVEGGAGLFTTEEENSVPVYLVGPGTPSTGDYLICRHVDYRWVAERSRSGRGAAHGTPCNIPSSDLTLSWYYWQVHYGGTYGTTYTPAGPIATSLVYQGGTGPNQNTWQSGIFAGPTDSVVCNQGVYSEVHGGYILGSACCYMKFTMLCGQDTGGPGQVSSLFIGLSSDPMFRPAPDGKAYCYDGTVNARTGSPTYSYSPFMITYQGTGFVGNLFAYGVVTP